MATIVGLTTPAELQTKERNLFATLAAMDRVIVAFSGGTDSAYLAWAAHRALGPNAVAITADSASLPESHKRDLEAFVAQYGIRHEYIQTREFDNPDYSRNAPTAASTAKTSSSPASPKSAAPAATRTSCTA
jgi:uncharacterized protein